MKASSSLALNLVHVACCICESEDATPIGLGEDFEYQTSRDTFLALQCNSCGLVYLNPRPAVSELEKIYPSNYHAFDFSEKDFGLIHKVRSQLEAKRLLGWCKDLPDSARVLDIGCGDGFHLKLLRAYGKKTWKLEGVDVDARAVRMAEKSGLKVHHGRVEELALSLDSYDLIVVIATLEHVENPLHILSVSCQLLKPGGRLVIVTDSTDSLDYSLFKGSYWGGYHFPRHWNLFNRHSLKALARKAGFEVVDLATAVSPVNWVYSIHNTLVDWEWPRWLINCFTLKSIVSLSVFTVLDVVLQRTGRGALLRAILRKPYDNTGK